MICWSEFPDCRFGSVLAVAELVVMAGSGYVRGPTVSTGFLVVARPQRWWPVAHPVGNRSITVMPNLWSPDSGKLWPVALPPVCGGSPGKKLWAIRWRIAAATIPP